MSGIRGQGWTQPLVGAAIGAAGGAAFWAGAQIWPASIAVAIAMLVAAAANARSASIFSRAAGTLLGLVIVVVAVLLRFNALMALSAAQLPFALPPNTALGLVMVAGGASSRALALSAPVWPVARAPGEIPARLHAAAPMTPPSTVHLAWALTLGFVPAALLGIRGLVAIAAALSACMAIGLYLRSAMRSDTRGAQLEPWLELAPAAFRELAETAFYLGALAVWPLV